MAPPGAPWWRDMVCYQIYVRSFADSDGDGIGDLDGIRSRLDHLSALGVDAVWLTPFYPSPMADHGYDVADPRAVDPAYGTLTSFDRLLTAAHERGLRVLVDTVPNHVSVAHPWFRAALAGAPGGPERGRFLFRDGRGRGGAQPPNNWRSTFGGPAWTRVPDGQWYLHLFAPEQPDLDWRHPDVPADAERTLRFWLDRGVDGFRIDVAHALFKAAGLPDEPGLGADLMADTMPVTGMWNQPEVHEVYRRWRELVDSYQRDVVLVGEVWLGDARVIAQYVRPNELSLAFNFRLLFASWDAREIAVAVDRSVGALGAVGAPSTWVLGNHDVQRVVTRYGGGDLGRRRARAAVLLLFALPGPAFLYAGDELGLADVDLPDEALQDPVWERSGHTIRGRDGCRVPLPWTGDAPPYGFSPSPTPTWLPQPPGWGSSTVARQARDADSMLELHRRALALRRAEPALGDGPLRWCAASGQVLDFVRPGDGARGVRCVVNFGETPVPRPPGEVLLASGPVTGAEVPPDTAVWLRDPSG